MKVYIQTPYDPKVEADLDNNPSESSYSGDIERCYQRLAEPVEGIAKEKLLLSDYTTKQETLRLSIVRRDNLKNELAIVNKDWADRWKFVIDTMKNLSVCLTHLFSAKFGPHFAAGKLSSRLARGMDLGGAVATGYWDDRFMRTSGFIFLLGHFGAPSDLKHLTGYGNDDLSGHYSQRRFVMLDVDADLYNTGLVMIHDRVYPRHLVKSGKVFGKNWISAPSILDSVVSIGDVISDPHQAKKSNRYMIVLSQDLSSEDDARKITVNPAASVVAGAYYRVCATLEALRFAEMLGLTPDDLNTAAKVIEFVNRVIRPQVMIPYSIDLPDARNLDIWGTIDACKKGQQIDLDLLAAEKELFANYVSEGGKPMGIGFSDPGKGMSKPVDEETGKLQERKGADSYNYRGFGWPLMKYTVMDRLTRESRWKYHTMWNGLPELASVCGSQACAVRLFRANRVESILLPAGQENTAKCLILPWAGKPVAL